MRLTAALGAASVIGAAGYGVDALSWPESGPQEPVTVITRDTTTGPCMIALATGGTGISVEAESDLVAGCEILAHSTSGTAITLSETSMVDAHGVRSAGEVNASQSALASTTKIEPFADLPSHTLSEGLADTLSARIPGIPDEPQGCTYHSFSAPAGQALTIYPGRYCGGMAIKGRVTMEPGLYVIDGGMLHAGSQSAVEGDGVTIVLTGADAHAMGRVEVLAGAAVTLSAPSGSDEWRGILMYQDPRGALGETRIHLGAQSQLSGALYLPAGDLRISGEDARRADCLTMVASRIAVSGSLAIDNECPAEYGA